MVYKYLEGLYSKFGGFKWKRMSNNVWAWIGSKAKDKGKNNTKKQEKSNWITKTYICKNKSFVLVHRSVHVYE